MKLRQKCDIDVIIVLAAVKPDDTEEVMDTGTVKLSLKLMIPYKIVCCSRKNVRSPKTKIVNIFKHVQLYPKIPSEALILTNYKLYTDNSDDLLFPPV